MKLKARTVKKNLLVIYQYVAAAFSRRIRQDSNRLTQNSIRETQIQDGGLELQQLGIESREDPGDEFFVRRFKVSVEAVACRVRHFEFVGIRKQTLAVSIEKPLTNTPSSICLMLKVA